MDGAMKSKRLFPNHTVAELQESLENPAINAVRRMDLEMAIAQRDKMSAFYTPIFIVPQVMA